MLSHIIGDYSRALNYSYGKNIGHPYGVTDMLPTHSITVLLCMSLKIMPNFNSFYIKS